MSTSQSLRESTTAYLNSHQIPSVLEQCLSKLVREKPSDPYLYLSQEFKSISDTNSAKVTAATLSANSPKVVFVLGGPGAGKGTQCSNIVRDYPFVHLSAGDLLREARNSGNEVGQMIDHYIKEGQIVPVEVTVNLIKSAMEKAIKEQNKHLFLIDGFPRNKDNLDGWYSVMGQYASVEFVLFFDCPESEMEIRLLKRGETSGRTDDNAESIRKRFHTYVESTQPIIQLFDEQGKCQKVDATRTPEAVYENVKQIFDAHKW